MKRENSWATLFIALLLSTITLTLIGLANANPIPPPPILEVYIRSDGSVDPSTAPIQRTGDIYTFTGDLTNSTIEVQRDNTVIDGAGFTLQGYGPWWHTGITLTNRSNVMIKNVDIRDYVYSIYLTACSNITIYDNQILAGDGILLDSSVDNQIIGNSMTAEETGYGYCIIFEDNSSDNTIISNSLYEAGGALHTMDGTNNRIYLNNFINNSNNVLGWVVGREGNFWDNMTQGNFWSDYQGVDADGDGLGDTPYLIQNRWLDKHPLMTPFNISSVIIGMPEWANSPQPEPFSIPITIAVVILVAIGTIALIVVICAGLLVYLKKRHPKTGDKST
jgi:nitrous oxidase accessory protein NosD